jgi:hypothetical protein
MRPLLTQGNGKVGQSIHLWSIPAISTCPGSTELCRSVCYANSARFTLSSVKERLGWCYEQSLRGDFAPRVVREIRRKGVLVLRVHVSGDFYSREYAEKWLEVMRQSPRVRFYWYSRSWRVPDIAPVLEQMAALRCCRAWYSLDAQTGIPPAVPPGVRLAYLQVEPDEEPELLDLLFVVRRLKRHAQRLGLPLLCPHQAGRRENCGECGKCFR